MTARAQSIAREGFGYGARAIGTMGYIVQDSSDSVVAASGGSADNSRQERDHYRPFNPLAYSRGNEGPRDAAPSVQAPTARINVSGVDRVTHGTPATGASNALAMVAPSLIASDAFAIRSAPGRAQHDIYVSVATRPRRDDKAVLMAALALLLDDDD